LPRSFVISPPSDEAEKDARTELPQRCGAPTDDEGEQMESVELSHQRSAHIVELPEDYAVLGLERRTPVARKPTGQIMRIQQNGRLTAATIAARRRLAVVARERLTT
jgi:hypothetical protein